MDATGIELEARSVFKNGAFQFVAVLGSKVRAASELPWVVLGAPRISPGIVRVPMRSDHRRGRVEVKHDSFMPIILTHLAQALYELPETTDSLSGVVAVKQWGPPREASSEESIPFGLQVE